MVVALASSPCAGGSIAATDFGDPADAPFAARQPSVARVPDAIRNLDTGELFDGLQAAIDDPDTLDGHTLQLEVAVQPEGQVAITKSVALQGMTGTEVFQAAVDTGDTGDDRGWFLVETGVTVTVHDLVFDGSGYRIFQAFRVKGGGSFAGCVFQAIQYDPSTTYAGTAIAAIGDVEVTSCTFTDIGRVGVLFFGAAVTNGLMEGCTYTGKGVGDWLDYMVEIGGGAYATVRTNVAQSCRGVASYDASESSGVNLNTALGPGTSGDVLSNTLLDNTRGIQVGLSASDSATATVVYNRMIGNEFGVGVNAAAPLVAENNWFGCNEGPGLLGCDVEDGGVDVDPWLVLGISADPTTILTGAISAVEASLTFNSDGADTSAGGNVPDGIPVTFAATLGTVSPGVVPTGAGVAGTTFTAGMVLGTATVWATADNATVETPIEVIEVPVELMTLTVE
jgi:hypothetical protein